MSAIIKGFVQIEGFINNQSGQINHVGELSDYGRTFSRKKTEHASNTAPGYNLITLKSTDAQGVHFIVPPVIVDEVFAVVKSALAYTQSHVRPYVVDDFARDLAATYYERIGSFAFGDISDNGSAALPQWMSWVSLTNNHTVIKIWLSDTALRNQYDEYSIDIIPPIPLIDQLFYPYNQALTLVRSRSQPELFEAIAQSRGDDRETALWMDMLGFVNILDAQQVNEVGWTSLSYGPGGDNIDARKDAIVRYIAENSNVDLDRWEKIFPDLFRRTEFYIVPRWDKEAVPNLTTLAQLYSTCVDPTESIQWACAYLSDVDNAKVRANLTCMPYGYKELSLMVIGGATNPDGITRIEHLYPDYLPLPNTSLDFDRMSTKTKEWVLFMEALLMDAEQATPSGGVSAEHRKVYRNGHLYVAATLGNTNFLVAAREDYLQYKESLSDV